MEYRSVQYAGVTLLLYGALAVVLTGLMFALDPAAGVVTFVPLAVISLVVAWFSRLEVTVGPGKVAAAFGRGWPRRAVDLATVQAVRAVRNHWYYGWGIRKIPRGWMFNVWGLDAIELELDTGKVFRIGTDEPDVLEGVLALQVR